MELIAQKREKLGKATKTLKNEGFVPAVIFGNGMDSVNISAEYNIVKKLVLEAGETNLIDIQVEGGDKFKVLVRDLNLDPISGKIIHVGFYKPNLKEKTSVQVPVEVIGEENNELLKGKEAVLLILLDEITVRALPMDLPHEFVVDVSNITAIGEGIRVSDLNFDKSKVEIEDVEETDFVVKLDDVEEMVEEEEVVSEEDAIAKMEATQETAKDEEEKDKEEK